MPVASKGVGRKTEPTGLGIALVVVSKIDTYGAIGKPYLPAPGASLQRDRSYNEDVPTGRSKLMLLHLST